MSRKISEKYCEIEPEGAVEKISHYITPKYMFSHEFYINIQLNHPWIEEIKIRLNAKTVKIKTTAKRGSVPTSPRTADALYLKYENMGNDAKRILEEHRMRSRKIQRVRMITECVHCGAPVGNVKDKMCRYCGQRLNII